MGNMIDKYLTKPLSEEDRKKVHRVLENIGVKKVTKLEQLARLFPGVKYHIDAERDSDTGTIYFSPKGTYFMTPTKEEIDKTAKRFYNEKDYLVVSSTYYRGFSIFVMESLTKGIKESLEKCVKPIRR
jgi:hypothetical protein